MLLLDENVLWLLFSYDPLEEMKVQYTYKYPISLWPVKKEKKFTGLQNTQRQGHEILIQQLLFY